MHNVKESGSGIYPIKWSRGNYFLYLCCSKVILSGLMATWLCQGVADDNPDDEGREADRGSTQSVSRRVATILASDLGFSKNRLELLLDRYDMGQSQRCFNPHSQNVPKTK